VLFESNFRDYCNAQRSAAIAYTGIRDFFKNLGLDYSVTSHRTDGVLLLNCMTGLGAVLSTKDVNDLARSKTKEDALQVINRLEFNK